MKNKWTRLFLVGIAMVSLTLNACGGGGGGDKNGETDQGSDTANYSLHVHITGLDGSVTLANESDTFVLSKDGEYVLSDLLTEGSSYNVSVTSQPYPQTCAVMHPAGNVSGDVDVIDIFVNCAELNAQAIILGTNDTSSLTTITPDSLVFSVLPSTLVGVMPGDVIFSEQTATAPDGLLRKVVSVDVVNGETVIETEDGVLTDIIQNGGFSIRGNISSQLAEANPQGIQISPSIIMMSSSSAAAANYCYGAILGDFVLSFNDAPAGPGVNISGCLGFNLGYDIGAKLSKLGRLESLHFIFEGEVAQALALSAEISTNNLAINYDILKEALGGKTFTFPAPFAIGPIVIPAGFEIDLFVAIGGSLDGTLALGGTSFTKMKAGGRLVDGELKRINIFEPVYGAIGPETTKSHTLQFQIGPKFGYKIAGVAGPDLVISFPYLKFNSNISNNPWWTLDAGLKADLALTLELNKIKGFGWLSDKWSISYDVLTLYDISRNIAQAQGPFGGSNTVPTANFNFSPLSPEVGQAVYFTNLSTDLDGDPLSSYWSFGDGNLSTATNPSHVYNIAGNYQVVLEVIDPSGDSGSSAQTITVSPATGATEYSLTIATSGTGSGTVTSDPTGISCGTSCSSFFTNGTLVTLTASPASGSTFTGWSGACTGSTTTCTVNMSLSRSVVATFNQPSGGDIASPWGAHLDIGIPFYNVFFEDGAWQIIAFELTSNSAASATFEGVTYTGTWAVDENEILNIFVSGPGSSYWEFLSAENNRVNVCFSDTLAGLNNCENEFFYFTLEDAEAHSTGSGGTLLPDTGQTLCYNTSGTIIDCTGTGQDGEFSVNPLSYTDNGNRTITDNVTGLIWQKATNDNTRTWQNAITYCAELALGGSSNWRLPSRYELMSIVDYGRYPPAIDPLFTEAKTFSDTFSYIYWSASPYAGNLDYAWIVFFLGGMVNYFDDIGHALCVRGDDQPTTNYTDNGNGTVTDSLTKFIWQKTDDDQIRNWQEALDYCNSLTLGGSSNWRLPNIKELGSVVDDSSIHPAANSVFVGAKSFKYWSSSSSVGFSNEAWVIDFDTGIAHSRTIDKTSSGYVRCMR